MWEIASTSTRPFVSNSDADAVAFQPRRQFVDDGEGGGGEFGFLHGRGNEVHCQAHAGDAGFLVVLRLLAEAVGEPGAAPVQQAGGALDGLFRTGRDFQNDSAVQHAGNLERVADMGGLIAGGGSGAVGGEDNAAAFAEGAFGGGAEMAQVARGVGPDGGGGEGTVGVRTEQAAGRR